MRPVLLPVALAVALAGPAGTVASDDADEANPAAQLAGLWRAQRSFGPELRGALLLERRGETWHGTLAGFRAEASAATGAFELEFPDGRGTLRGRYDSATRTLRGHWVQPPPVQIGGAIASPVRFSRIGPERWQGQVLPRASEYTFYMKIQQREDDTLGAFLRNPDRNLGVFYDIEHVERDGDALRFVGRFFRSEESRVLFEGTYHGPERFSVDIPSRGGSYDFARVDDEEVNGFYARARTPPPWTYRPPPRRDDGWETAALESVGIALRPLRAMIETQIDPVAQDVHAHYVHGVLIARHGKLVLEEYFHGFHRDEPHDTRSASKSLTGLLAGAVIQAGTSLTPSTPVYETILGAPLPADLDPRKRSMTLEHLLTMASGFHCDDNDYDAPGNEEVMQNQTDQPDWYAYTMAVPLASRPGETPVYCSAASNLIGAVLRAATGRPVEQLFETLVAEPLDVERYYLFLQPTGEPYMGGGIHWLPRDFMKLGQVILDGGTWNGRRIVSQQWAEAATSPRVDLRGRGYGYQWWSIDYPYADRSVRAFFAGGNGGQVVIGVPALDLLIAFYGGNYSDRILFKAQNVLVPEYILPAVEPPASR